MNMCGNCSNQGCNCQYDLTNSLARQQGISGLLGMAQNQLMGIPTFGYDIGELFNPKYPPTTAQQFGKYGHKEEADRQNIHQRRERNIADVWQCRRFQQDELNKERRATYDAWIKRRDLWNEENEQ